jgi:hypothetical protein
LRPVACKIPVHASSRRGICEVPRFGVNDTELTHQNTVLPEIVFLVVILGPVKVRNGKNIRADGPAVSRLLPLSGFQSKPFLLFPVIKQSCPVLPRLRGPGWIMGPPEEAQQFFVGYVLRVEFYLQRFAVIAQVVVGRVSLRRSGITDPRPHNCVDAPELCIGSPESPEGKRRRLRPCRRGPVDGRPQVCLSLLLSLSRLHFFVLRLLAPVMSFAGFVPSTDRRNGDVPVIF